MEARIIQYLQTNDVHFAHVITVAGYFAKNIVEFVQNNAKDLQAEKHVFLIDESEISKELEQYPNVFCIKKLKMVEASILEELAKHVNNIILHFLDFEVISKISNQVAQKIIWRTWGNDLTYSISYYPTFKLKVKAVYKKLIWNTKGKALIKKFKAIAISASECDRLELKRQKIKNKIYRLPYPTQYWEEDFSALLKRESKVFQKKDDEFWIMIGHSANSALKHQKILRMIAGLRDENVRIIMPMSYGRKEYREKVRAEAYKLFGEKVCILDDNLPYDEYVCLLNKIDVAFFDAKHQMGLGNIVDLLLLGKVVFLNKKGIVYQTLTENNVKTYDCCRAKKCCLADLQQLKKEHDPTFGTCYARGLRSKQFVIADWVKLLNDFKSEK